MMVPTPRAAAIPPPADDPRPHGRCLHPFFPRRVVLAALVLTACALIAPARAMAVGTWTPLTNPAPANINLMLLLSDGTVMGQGYAGADWYRLTPDASGSYANGTWTTLAPMHDARLYYTSQVLRDGRVFVAGGEYGTGGTTSEIYDPATDTWTLTSPPTSVDPGVNLADGESNVLPNGNVLVAPLYSTAPPSGFSTLIFDIVTETWSLGPPLLGYTDEGVWVKLPDDSLLTVDLGTVNAERYIPSLNQWIADAPVPTELFNSFGEAGGAHLLPNGKAFFIGATSHTAIYTPSGSTAPGTWVAGADIPGDLGAVDAPSAMMANGKILCAFGHNDQLGGETFYYEYDYASNTFTQVNSPFGGLSYPGASFVEVMLDLPDGTVLFAPYSTQLFVYTPDGKPVKAGKPHITRVIHNLDGSYHLIGKLFNGISQGAVYGDDIQTNTNYPIARITDLLGNVYYGRTFDWSSTGVRLRRQVVTTEMTLPAGLPDGKYSLYVSANGISSRRRRLIVGPGH